MFFLCFFRAIHCEFPEIAVILQNTDDNRSMKDLKIMHHGTVRQIKGHHVVVRINRGTACSSCGVAGYCHVSDAHGQLIDVYDASSSDFHVGDTVKVWISASSGRYAVVTGFVLPLILLITTIVLMRWFTGNDGVAALSGLIILLPYYIGIYLSRGFLSRHLTFHLEPF